MSRSAKLHALQLTDSEIDQRSIRLSQVESLLGETEALLSARVQVEQVEKILAQHRAQQRTHELTVQDLEHKKEASEQKLYGGKIRNPKELSDLQGEIASLDRRKGGIEDQLLETMMRIDEWEAKQLEVGKNLDQIETEWRATQEGLIDEKANLESRLAELSQQRQGWVTEILATDLSSYEHLRPRKRGIAVAILDGAECQGCMTSVSAARVKEARSDSLAYCGTCGRILHVLGRS